jgi:fumarate hydratase class II
MKAAQISLLAYREDIGLKPPSSSAISRTEQFDQWVRPKDMTHPSVA